MGQYILEQLDKYQKELLLEIVNDHENGIKEDVIYESYKDDIMNNDGDFDPDLADWMVFDAAYEYDTDDIKLNLRIGA
jgi:hypothetical protein